MTGYEAKQIEMSTKDQSQSKRWKEERSWRLTASKFGEICKSGNPDALSQRLLNPPDLSTPAVVHGRTYEDKAINLFSEKTGKKVLRSGLVIRPDFPHLGASPDGVVDGEGSILEVKCPYQGRQAAIKPGKFFPFLENRGGKTCLKKKHNYMYQVQGQLFVTKSSKCYFCVYTHKDFMIEEIEYDQQFVLNEMLPCLNNFNLKYFQPVIASTL